jgi:subtilisin family serine protease
MSVFRSLRTALVLGGILALPACHDTTPPTAPEEPALAVAGAAGERIIVVFDRAVFDPPGLARKLAAEYGGTLQYTYQYALEGFAGTFPATAAAGLARHPGVDYVAPDGVVHAIGIQSNPPAWGIDRIDQADLPLNNSYTWPNNGSGARIYILDTGIRPTHVEFGGRASYIPNGSNGDFVHDAHGNANGALDCYGHGTHVAGTAAGVNTGVAKGALVIAGRVLDCNGSGTEAGVIAGIDWITGNGIKPAVVSMSLGGSGYQPLVDAVENSIAAGFSYAVAAGNGDPFFGFPDDACYYSPANAPNANTVGATKADDNEAEFSNYGTCVDILAPGYDIRSAWSTGDNAYLNASGTSMATPHVAGALALYLTANPAANPAQASQALKANAAINTIFLHIFSEFFGTANRFLQVGWIGGGTPPANNPPTAGFTYSCSDLSCSFIDTSTDGDGSIASRSWSFGDGGTSAATNPSHTYAAGGTYSVMLTATDDDGAPDSETRSVTVTAGGAGDVITLVALNASKGRNKRASLTWSGSSAASVDVYRNGLVVATTANDGLHTDVLPKGTTGSRTYRVCNAGTSTCSNDATVTF